LVSSSDRFLERPNSESCCPQPIHKVLFAFRFGMDIKRTPAQRNARLSLPVHPTAADAALGFLTPPPPALA